MRAFRITVLQWAVGCFCALLGALILVAPHQFQGALYQPLLPVLPDWGLLFLSVGSFMLAVAVLGLPVGVARVAHVVTGVALLLLAVRFSATHGWTGLMLYILLGLGVLAAPWLAAPDPSAARHDLATVLLGVGATLIGGLLLVLPGGLGAAGNEAIVALTPWYGLSLFVAGGLLVIAQFRRSWPAVVVQGAHLTAGAVFLAIGLTIALPLQLWAGLLLCLGAAVLAAAGPHLPRLVAGIDPRALRTRLALALAATAALPLILAVALVGGREQQTVLQTAQARQQSLATSLALDVADYLAQRQQAINVLASQPDLVDLAPPILQRRLNAVVQLLPDLLSLTLFDPTGRPLASTGGDLGAGPATSPVMARARQVGLAVIDIRRSPRTGQPMIEVAAPLFSDEGVLIGILAGSIDANHLSAHLASAYLGLSDHIYLIDASGRGLTHRGPDHVTLLADLSALPPVAAVLASGSPGTLRYQGSEGERLAGYAPVPGLGWSIVVEEPASVALAGVTAGRDLAFWLLLVSIGAASAVGVIVAGWLATPLASLVRTVEQLTAGDQAVPLPRAGVSEVDRLAAAVARQRDRLARRTTERERAEAGLRFVALASQHLATSLDLDATTRQVVELAAPELADAATVHVLSDQGVLVASDANHREPAVAERLRAAERAHPPVVGDASPAGRVLATGQPRLHLGLSSATRAAHARSPECLALYEEFAPHASLALPLRAGERCIGVLTLWLTDPARAFDGTAMTLAEEVARRAGLALEHARLYQQAQSGIRLRDEFLAIAWHELRTPLTTIKGYLQLVERQGSQGRATVERLLATIAPVHKQVERLETLVRDLLDVAQLRQGHLAPRPVSIDLALLARQVADRLAEAPHRRANHRVVIEAPAPVVGRWDPSRLDQVLTNLIGNAIKYSPTGGEVHVSVRREGDQAVVAVRDEGVGIASDDLATLFQPFSRGQATARAIQGVGLGLYIAHQIVERHGGAITVESRPDAGSVFTVRLPLTTGAVAAARAVPMGHDL